MSRNLTPFFRPRSVAVVGAGERPTSSGGAVCRNLEISGFKGDVIPVNPKGGMVFGRPALTSLRELARPVDLAVIVIRPELIPEAVREAAETGHKHLLILPGGFAEAGSEGRARDAEVRAIAAQAGLTIAGPNCAGIVALSEESRFGATFLRDMPPGGGLAFVSQSGALAEEVIAAANESRIPFGAIVSVGNAMHLGVADYLEHLGDDPRCSAVFLYVESVEDRARFARVARAAAARKPVVLLMGGRTAPGARAAALHTGATPTDDGVIERFAHDACALRVTSLRSLLLAAKGFGFFPQGFGRRAFILSNSGGPGVLCADRAVSDGLDLPPLPGAMAERLRTELPPEAAVANPIDLLADAREDRFGLALDLALEHGPTAGDAILMIHVVPFMVDASPVIARLAAAAKDAPLPILHSMMGTLPGKADWFARMEQAGVPTFNDVEAMAECAALLAGYPELRRRASSSSGAA
jgi:acetyltransferase